MHVEELRKSLSQVFQAAKDEINLAECEPDNNSAFLNVENAITLLVCAQKMLRHIAIMERRKHGLR